MRLKSTHQAAQDHFVESLLRGLQHEVEIHVDKDTACDLLAQQLVPRFCAFQGSQQVRLASIAHANYGTTVAVKDSLQDVESVLAAQGSR
jgi:hypothetical protein